MPSFRKTATGTADATGTVTITLPEPPVQQKWVASVSVPESGPGVTWTVLLDGTPVATVQGSSGYGQVSISSGQSLQMTSSNAMADESYQAVIQYSVSGTDVTPPPQLTAVATTLPIVPLASGVITTSPQSVTVPIVAFYRTVLLTIIATSAGGTVSLVGNVTKANYGTAAIKNGLNAIPADAAFFSAFDTAVTVTFTGVASGSTFFISADQTTDEEFILGTSTDTLVRADGRAYPEGLNLATTTANNNSVSIVAAPGAGNRLLVKTMSLASEGAALGHIDGTIGGATTALIVCYQSSEDRCDQSGLLMDANTGLSLVSGAAINVVGSVTYDVVT